MPKQPDQPTTNTSASATVPAEGSAPTEEVTQSFGPKTEFHKTATERQRFQVHLDFGRIFETQGNFEAAVLEYRDALTVAETRGRGELKAADEAIAHRRMGGALDRLGRFAVGEVHYKKAIKISPKDPRIWNDIGYSYYLQSRWPEAEAALRTAAKLAPDDERIKTNLGLTLAAAGRTEEALPLLSRTVGDATGHMNLGYSLAATGQLDLARQQYETALAMQPDLSLARRAISQLDRQKGLLPADSATQIAKKSTTGATVDSGVTKASMSPRPASPPLPARSLPNAPVAGQP
jgi:Flp pilus assembly protein TadD